ncbi:hypothetical protein J7E25_09370 [Agromyces sp. ISL-38]|nr:hypothetical protein [Agromyces sp. ISL-38]
MPPTEPFSIEVHVSHHGESALHATVHAAWVPAGSPVDELPKRTDASTDVIRIEPFTLSDAETITVPPSGGPARLVLWLLDEQSAVSARSFLDAAEVEPPNRRGARAGEFLGAPLVGEA